MSKMIRPIAAVVLLVGLAGCVGAPVTAVPYYAPVAGGPVYLGSQCMAGAYQCALAVAGPIGTQCSCPGLGAPSYGVIR